MKTTLELNPTAPIIAQLAQIYAGSFPASEKADFKLILEDIHQRRRELFLGLEGHEVLGAAILIPLAVGNFYFLEYLMVKAERRSQGLGTRLLQALAEHLTAAGVTGLLLEVESQRVGTQAERSLRSRRIKFYLRNKFHLLEQIPFHTVPDLGDPHGWLEMRYLWRSFEKQPADLAPAQLQELVRQVYLQSYALPPESEFIRKTLALIAASAP